MSVSATAYNSDKSCQSSDNMKSGTASRMTDDSLQLFRFSNDDIRSEGLKRRWFAAPCFIVITKVKYSPGSTSLNF